MAEQVMRDNSHHIAIVHRDLKQDPCHRLPVNALAYSSDRDVLYTAGRDAIVNCWELNWSVGGENSEEPVSPNHLAVFTDHYDWVNDLDVAEEIMLTASSDTSIKLWSTRISTSRQDIIKPLYTFTHHRDYVKCVQFINTNPKRAISAGFDGRLYLMDIEARTSIKMADLNASIYALQAAVDGNMVFAGTAESNVHVLDLRNDGKHESAILPHAPGAANSCVVKCLAVSKGLEYHLISGSSNGTIRLWDLRNTQKPLKSLDLHQFSIWSLEVGEDGAMYSADSEGLILRTDLKTEQTWIAAKANGGVLSMATLPKGLAASTLSTSEVGFYSCLSGEQTNAFVKTEANEEPDAIDGREELRQCGKIVAGLPKTVHAQIMANKLQVLSVKADGTAELIDILSGRCVKMISGRDVEELLSDEEQVWWPAWCTAGIRMGASAIVLSSDTCFNLEMPLDLLQPNLSTERANVGKELLGAVCVGWVNGVEKKDLKQALTVEHDPCVVFIVDTSRTDRVAPIGLSSVVFPMEIPGTPTQLPSWLRSLLETNEIPLIKPVKIQFYLRPAEGAAETPALPPGTERLIAATTLTVAKMQRYLMGKLELSETQDGVFDIFCEGKLLNKATTLGTVRNIIQKNKVQDPQLVYILRHL